MRGAAAVVAGIALTGCAALAPPAPGPVLSGRIAVQVDAPPGGQVQSLSAHFELAGDAERGSLSLSTPFGTRLGQANWALPGEVTLVRAGGARAAYPDLDALTRELLGEAVPVGALFDWLAGRPWPAVPDLPAQPPVTHGFRQLGWQVDLDRIGDGVIVARRDAPPPVTVRARLDSPSASP